jgi:hypothetical protein
MFANMLMKFVNMFANLNSVRLDIHLKSARLENARLMLEWFVDLKGIEIL